MEHLRKSLVENVSFVFIKSSKAGSAVSQSAAAAAADAMSLILMRKKER